MDIIQRQQNIGIVVVGNFDPTKLTPKWLYELNIITAEEWNGQERNLLVSNPITKFRFGQIEFLSQPSRIQLISNDVSLSNHLVNMTMNILKNYGETKLKAVGVNAGVLFTFANSDDSLRFGQYLGQLQAMNAFFGDPRLRSVTFEDNQQPTADIPKTSIIIQAEETAEERQKPADNPNDEPKQDFVPVCSMQVNNHFVVETMDQALKVVSRAEVLHNDFREKTELFFRNI